MFSISFRTFRDKKKKTSCLLWLSKCKFSFLVSSLNQQLASFKHDLKSTRTHFLWAITVVQQLTTDTWYDIYQQKIMWEWCLDLVIMCAFKSWNKYLAEKKEINRFISQLQCRWYNWKWSFRAHLLTSWYGLSIVNCHCRSHWWIYFYRIIWIIERQN